MFDSLTPNFNDEDAAADVQAYEIAPTSFVFPLKAEWAIAKGVFTQTALAVRDLIVTPLLIFKPGVSKETRSYSIMVSVAILLAFLFISFMKIDMDLMVSWLATQKYYKLWAYYTIMYVTQKYIPKMHNFCHSQIRGAIRAGKTFSIFAIIVNSVAYVLLYMHQTLYIGTFVAGKDKDKTFFSTVLHNQFIYYKKFIPKATEGNPFIVESLNRIIAIFAFIYIYHSCGWCTKLLMLVFFEYGCAYIRFFLIAITDDGQNFLEKIRKLASQAIAFLSGHQSVSTNETVYLTSAHEGIALLFAVLLTKGTLLFKGLLFGAIVFLAYYSLVFGKDDKEEEKPKEEEKKEDEEKEDEQPEVVPPPEGKEEEEKKEEKKEEENKEAENDETEGKIEEAENDEGEADGNEDGGDDD